MSTDNATALHTDELVAYVERMGNLTIGEVTRWLAEAGVAVEGDHYLHAAKDPNIIFWGGMSDQASDEVVALMDRPEVVQVPHIDALSVFAIFLGHHPGLPVVQNPPARGYKKPHWLPMTLRLRKPGDPAGKWGPDR